MTGLVVAALLAAAPLKIAVLDLETTGVDADAVRTISDMFVTKVAESGCCKVVSRNDIAALLGFEKQKQMLGCGDTACVAEIAGALGVDKLASGSVGRIGNTYTLTLRLVDVKTALVEERFGDRVTGEVDALLDLLDRGVAKITARLLQPQAPGPEAPPPAGTAPAPVTAAAPAPATPAVSAPDAPPATVPSAAPSPPAEVVSVPALAMAPEPTPELARAAAPGPGLSRVPKAAPPVSPIFNYVGLGLALVLAGGGAWTWTQADGARHELLVGAPPPDRRHDLALSYWNDTGLSNWLFAGGAGVVTSAALIAAVGNVLQDTAGESPDGKPLRSRPTGWSYLVLGTGLAGSVAFALLATFAEVKRQDILARPEIFSPDALDDYWNRATLANISIAGTGVLMAGGLVAMALFPEAFVKME